MTRSESSPPVTGNDAGTDAEPDVVATADYAEQDATANVRLLPIEETETELVLALEVHGLQDVHGLGMRLLTDPSQLVFDRIESAGGFDGETAGHVHAHAFESGEIWIGAAMHGWASVDATEGVRVGTLTLTKQGEQPNAVEIIESKSSVLRLADLTTIEDFTWSGAQRAATTRVGPAPAKCASFPPPTFTAALG